VTNGKRAAALGCGLLLAALAGCGGSGEGAKAAREYEPKSEIPWKDKSREQRMDWMAVAVFPKMRHLFQEQDGEKYADFSCQTCHGREMERVDFRMPNDLFALDAEDTVAHAKEYDEKTTDFMLGAVVPEMAKLLDTDAYTLENQQGFGCAGCHPTAK
jgi:cytochrome c553